MTPLRKAGAARPFLIMAGLCISAALVRAPFLSVAGVDEAFYLVVARQWLEGTPPYVGAFDVKPPLLFGLMAFAETVFGPSLFAAKALSMAAVAITSCGIYLFGRRFLAQPAGSSHVHYSRLASEVPAVSYTRPNKSPVRLIRGKSCQRPQQIGRDFPRGIPGELSGVAAAFFYIVSSVSLGGALSPAELLMAPFTVFGMLAGFSAAQTACPAVLRALIAGLLFGAAACVKQTALFEAMPLAAYLLFGRRFADGFRAIAAFAAGFSIIPSAFALYFYAAGHLDALVAHAVVSAVARAGLHHVAWGDASVRFSIELMLVLPLALMALAMFALRSAFREGGVHAAIGFLGAWAAGAFAAVLATRAMCGFYMLAALPSLCLLSGAYFEHGAKRLRRPLTPAARVVASMSVLLFFAAAIRSESPVTVDSESAANAAAAAMKSAGLSPKDRLFVVDRALIVYLTSGANPPGPIFNPIQFLCDFVSEGSATALADSLASRPAFIVVSNPPDELGCEKPGARALIGAALAAHYKPIGHFGAEAAGPRSGSFDLYRRVDPPQAS